MKTQTEHIDQAFQVMKRMYFLPSSVRLEADFDEALPIGYGQTNSQPYTVRLMLEWLDPYSGQRVLDVGSGSGWTTALLSYLVAPNGFVFAVEKVPELVEFGRANCEQLGIKNVQFEQAGQQFGWPEHGPYDRILVSASAATVPAELIEQLKIGGKMVIPVGHDIIEVTKHKDKIEQHIHPGFVFVPLT